MSKKNFKVITIIGILIITILSFTLPSDPHKIIPAFTVMSFDKPLWVFYMFGGSILYLLILSIVYNKLSKKKS